MTVSAFITLINRARRIHQPRVRIYLDVFVPGKDTRAVRIMLCGR